MWFCLHPCKVLQIRKKYFKSLHSNREQSWYSVWRGMEGKWGRIWSQEDTFAQSKQDWILKGYSGSGWYPQNFLHRKRASLVQRCPWVPVRASAFSTNQTEKICRPTSMEVCQFSEFKPVLLDRWLLELFSISPNLSLKFYLYHPLLSTKVFLTQPDLCFVQHLLLWAIHKLHVFTFFCQSSVCQKVSQMQQVKSLMSVWFYKISNWNGIVSGHTFA